MHELSEINYSATPSDQARPLLPPPVHPATATSGSVPSSLPTGGTMPRINLTPTSSSHLATESASPPVAGLRPVLDESQPPPPASSAGPMPTMAETGMPIQGTGGPSSGQLGNVGNASSYHTGPGPTGAASSHGSSAQPGRSMSKEAEYVFHLLSAMASWTCSYVLSVTDTRLKWRQTFVGLVRAGVVLVLVMVPQPTPTEQSFHDTA